MGDAQRKLEEWARKKSKKHAKRANRVESIYDQIKRGDTSHGLRGVSIRKTGHKSSRLHTAGGAVDKGQAQYWKEFWGKVEDLRSKKKTKDPKRKKKGVKVNKDQDIGLKGRKDVKESTLKVERVNLDLHSNNGDWRSGVCKDQNIEALYGTKLEKNPPKVDEATAKAVKEKMQYYKELARREFERRKHEAKRAAKQKPPRPPQRPERDEDVSNTERFFMDEMKRFEEIKKNRKPRYQPPNHINEAKNKMKQFQKDINRQFSKFGANSSAGKSPKEAGASAAAQSHTSSTSYSGAGVTLPSKHAALSVKELVIRLRNLKVPVSGFREKKDLVAKLVEAEQEFEKKLAAERVERERQETESRILREVRRWARGKGIKEILNSLMDTRRGDPLYLNRLSTFSKVSRVYKRALMKIHPDKNMGSFERLTRATEQFKIVNSMYQAYKDRQKA
mmetsp:Transcript_9210/g.18040  ORF Transcript_9210/g.18040 Transcript_9210/m.18040 type:complete len:448 (+) Transcript_9210:148-1491(+)|eukprot:CAMPEP_0167820682 /NCGR_PEP_ID=MMETSP0112_2-20121227/6252_1 /TAXON_ID=91324 /ORGANISM="Lotharella globosa, Strain CCCM811" /LENGTH=447 /DNA_ID=CAMNT_0007721317 /DNA_START=123 /DNA_END=1466 /DNA_ORIENTATION=-